LKKLSVLSLLVCSIFAFASCDDDNQNTIRFEFDEVPAAFDTTGIAKVTLEDDFYFYDIVTGSGYVVTPLDIVSAHYTLRFKRNGRVISSTYVNGSTIPGAFVLGTALEVYRFTGVSSGDFLGFRRGVVGMKIGGKRTLVVPPRYGFSYNETFLLDIELTDIVIK
jgi:peptidylprolyl isomerase